MKINQIAIYAQNPALLKAALHPVGLTEWIHDRVTAEGEVYGKPARNEADLFFNHDLGIEFEILKYRKGNHLYQHKKEKIFLSHLGIKLSDINFKIFLDGMKLQYPEIKIAQKVKTIKHTNPALKNRFFNYVIYDSCKEFGYNLKLING